MSSSAIAESAWPSSNMDVSVGELESYVDLPDTSENEATKNEVEGGQVAKEQQQYTGYHTTTPEHPAHHGFEVAWNHAVGDLNNSHEMPQRRDNSLAELSQDHQTAWVTAANVHLDQTMTDVVLNETQNEAQIDMEQMPLGSTAELAGSADPFIAGGFSNEDDINPSNPSVGDEDTISPGQISQPNSPTPNQGRTRSSSRRKPKSDSAQSQQVISAAEKKSAASKRGRKVYCICRTPDDGNTMVQCDVCKEWYHIACVGLSEEEVQKIKIYMCESCQQTQNSGGVVTGRKVIPESTVTTRSRKNTSGENAKAGQEDTEVRKNEIEPIEPNQEPRMCLYPGCPNQARAGSDDYCSDNCTVKDSENVLRRLAAKNNPEPIRTAQFHHRKTEDREWTPEEEEEDDEEEQHLRSQVKRSNSTSVFRRPRTYSSSKKRSEEISEQSITPPASFPPQPVPEAILIPPAQVSPEQDPVRRNVIKNMTDVMTKIVAEAIEKDPELFTAPINSPATPRTPWTDSPIHPMDDQALSQQRQDEKEGSTSASPTASATLSNAINTTPPSAEEISNRLSRAIELSMFELLVDPQPSGPPKCGERYKGKFRSLLFNLKDKANDVFRLRVVTGDLTPEELIRMSAEDMANPALKSMSEVLRKRSIKDSVLKTQPNAPFIKKTHKGEVYLSTEPMMTYEREDKETERMPGLMEIDVEKSRADERESSNAGPAVISPTTPTLRTDTLEEILARMGNGGSDEPARKGKRASVDFSKEGQNEKKMKMSPKLDVEDDAFAFDSDSDEAMEDSGFGAKQQKPSNQQDSVTIDKSARSPNYTPYTPSPPNSPHTPDYSPPPSPGFSYKPIWRGKLLMQQVAQFEAEAVQIGGRPNLKGTDIPVMWEGVLSASTIAIDGRIPPDRVTDYLTQTQFSITKELTLVEFRPVVVDEDTGAGANRNGEANGDIGQTESDGTKNEKVNENIARFDTLLEYFSSRARFGVVGVKYMPTVKDMYIVPLRKDAPLPDCLVTMEHNLVETDRDRNMLLGIVVVNKKPPPSLKRSSNRKPKETRRDSKEAETNAESLFSPRDREIEEGEKSAEVVMEAEEEYMPQVLVQNEPDRTIQIPSEPVASTTINTSTIPLTAPMSVPAPTIPTDLNPLLSQLLNNPDVLKLLSATSAGLNNNASNPPPSASTVVNSIMGLNLGGLVMSQPTQAPPQQQYIPPLSSLPQAGLYEPAVSIVPSIPHNAPTALTPQYQPFYSQQPGNSVSQAYDPANPLPPPMGMGPPPFYETSRSGYQDHPAMQNKWEEERNWESRERGRDHRDGPHHPDDRGLDWDQRARERGYNRVDGPKGGREYHPYPSRDRDRDRKWCDEEDGGYRRDEHRVGRGARGGGRGRGGSWGGYDTRGGHAKKSRGKGNNPW